MADGVAALWRGLLPRLVLKSFGSSVWYTVYMASRRHLSERREAGALPRGVEESHAGPRRQRRVEVARLVRSGVGASGLGVGVERAQGVAGAPGPVLVDGEDLGGGGEDGGGFEAALPEAFLVLIGAAHDDEVVAHARLHRRDVARHH